MVSALPFDDFRRLARDLPAGDDGAERQAGEALADGLPLLDLAGIADLAAWLARWSGRAPRILRPLVAVFAGAHGVALHLASEAELPATRLAVERLGAGDQPVNRICAASDVGLKVFELALDVPTGDISRDAALDERDCAATMAFGMEAVAGGTDLLCLGGIGVGGPAVAAAVLMALRLDGDPARLAVDDFGLNGREVERVAAALALHRAHLADPFELLRRLGGREIAAIAGAILAARFEKVPVVLEGPAALAAAAVLHAANPSALAHCRLAGRFAAPGYAEAARRLGLAAVLDMPLGSPAGAGAAIAAGVLKAAASACGR